MRLHDVSAPPPPLREPVVARRHKQRRVGAEVKGRDGVGVGGHLADDGAGLDVPQADGLVEAAGGDEVAVRAEVGGEDEAGVAAKDL
jgi:hypothetical protein